MTNITKGMLVENVGAPQWGPGKVVHASADKLHIIFRDLEEEMARIFQADSPVLRIAQQQRDAILDNLPPLVESNGRWILPSKRLTFNFVTQKFLHHFPAAFTDPDYLLKERGYKLAAHVKFQQLLAISGIRELLVHEDFRTLSHKALTVLSAVNLLSPYESAAFHDAMQDDYAVKSFFITLLEVLETNALTSEIFDKYTEAVTSLPAARGRVATWPVATIFPYLADPARYMFLKPEVTKSAAESLGFDLQYNATPNWTTYAALQRMGQIYLDLLRPLCARDFLDVQSFIWITCGGYDQWKTQQKKSVAS